jgi:hypothetical protein
MNLMKTRKQKIKMEPQSQPKTRKSPKQNLRIKKRPRLRTLRAQQSL